MATATAVESIFDVAYWFMDRALNEEEYIQPQKLHRIMYLAQGYYAVAYAGRKLMPATFIAAELGPLEPNLFRALEIARPAIEHRTMPKQVLSFLDSVWRRFGTYSSDYLNRSTKGHQPWVEAWEKGPRSEISFDTMREFYATRNAPDQAAPSVDSVVRPTVLRTATGKAVAVKHWMPGGMTAAKKPPGE